MKYSSSTVRRKYPREYNGGKNEWKAMVNHFSETEVKAEIEERAFEQLKRDILKENFELQILEKQRMLQNRKERELQIEKDMIRKDVQSLNEELLSKRSKKRALETNYMNENEKLLKFRKNMKDNETLEREKEEHYLIDRDLNGEDSNTIKSLNLEKLSRQYKIDNMRIIENRQRNTYRTDGISQKISRPNNKQGVHFSQTGDIFDSMFSRPQQWRQFYDNIMLEDQVGKIKSHKANVYEKELFKRKAKEVVISNNVKFHQEREIEKEAKKLYDHEQSIRSYRESLNNLYGNSQENNQGIQSEDELYWRTQQGQKRKEELERYREESKEQLYRKKQAQNSYRNILNKQRESDQLRSLKSKQMTRTEKKFNYEDLQAWKDQKLDYYTRSVPGIACTVNKSVAARILGLYGKNGQGTIKSRVINQNLGYREKQNVKRH